MKVRHEYSCTFEEQKVTSNEFSPTYQVRSPTESDVDELAELMFDSYQGTIDYDGETIQKAKSEVKSYFERPDSRPLISCSLVALLEGRIISACLLSKWEMRPNPLISYIMTRSNFRGKGLGRAIVYMALQRVRTAGCNGAVAVVTEGNIPSERLLVGLGFRRVD